MFNTEIDYKKLYKEKYRKIPNRWFAYVWVMSMIASIVVGVAVANGDGFVVLFVLLCGVGVGYVIALLVKREIAVSLSQKIVVADTLLELAQKAPASEINTQVNAEDFSDIPEL